MNKEEKHVMIKCKKCGDIVIGDGKGTYIVCSCKSIAIDETKYYCRIIGNEKDFEIVKKGDNVE